LFSGLFSGFSSGLFSGFFSGDRARCSSSVEIRFELSEKRKREREEARRLRSLFASRGCQ